MHMLRLAVFAVVMAVVLASTVRAAEPVPAEHPRLFFHKADLPALRKKAGTPEGKAILARLDQCLAAPAAPSGQWSIGASPARGFQAAGFGFRYQLTGNVKDAEAARQLVEAILADPKGQWNNEGKWIIRSPQLQGVAEAYDLCFDAWPEDVRGKIAQKIDALAASAIKGGGEGWNGSLESNWNAITRGGAGVGALAVLGDPGAPKAQATLDEALKLTARWLKDALDTNGQGGEGDVYTNYALCQGTLPFAAAYKCAQGKDLLGGTHGDAIFANALQKSIVAKDSLLVPNYGPYDCQWKTEFYHSGDWTLMLGLAPDKLKPAMLWAYNRRFGALGDGSFDIVAGPRQNCPQQAMLALVHYPVGLKEANPETLVPRNSEGTSRGHYLFRNGWKDGNDLVAAFWLKAAPINGWNNLDTASFRIFGFDTAWATKIDPALGPNSNGGRGESAWRNENVVLTAAMKGEGRGESSLGKRVFYEARPDGGGIVTGDLAAIYGGTALRCFAVDYSGDCGAPGLYVVADKLSAEGTKTWQLHTRAAKVEAADRRFTLTNAGGATLVGTVISPADAKLVVTGKTIQATSESGEFLIVMTLQNGPAPTPKASDAGLASKVTLGKRVISFDGEKIILGK